METFDPDRYSRQTRFTPLGGEGQSRLVAARVAVVGCGALGGVSALALARAGVGHLRLIDRDVPERSNLPRQVLFEEADIEAGLPKAVVAAKHLARINSATSYEPIVADLTADRAATLLRDVDLVVPGRTACLRCLVPEPPAPGSLPTCDTAGIIGPTALVVGAVQAAEAMKLLACGEAAANNRLLVCDLWEGSWRTVDLAALAKAGCPTCRGGDFPWLEARLGGRPTALCGRDAVQVPAPSSGGTDLTALATRLRSLGLVTANAWMVRAEVEPGVCLSVFADGRTIVSGTRDEARARTIVSRYLGS
jgi:molybdopterin/thiamine biosynthesis adenylyltransferase